MLLKDLSKKLGIKVPNNLTGIDLYNKIRSHYLRRHDLLSKNKFQSPSIDPSVVSQRSNSQNKTEHSVYQRADYTPILSEQKFNNMYPILEITPKTLFFNSGMAAISTLMFFLKNSQKYNSLSIGENAYFETKWLIEDYKNTNFINEYSPILKPETEVLWLEYPLNCTNPSKYPFDQSFNISKLINQFKKLCLSDEKTRRALVVDYTLGYLPFDVDKYFKKVPNNLSIYLVTSLQKHRGYGLDLTNAGAITFYSKCEDEYEYFKKLRAIMGTSVTQETIWTMPEINSKIINKIIRDSGINAKKLFLKINKYNFYGVKYHYSLDREFSTSFIFIEIEKKLMEKSKIEPYFSDLLISEIMKSAKRNKCILVCGTSFGLPSSRIFKNSERYDNTSSLRIAVGYDQSLNIGLDKALIEGTKSFIKIVNSL